MKWVTVYGNAQSIVMPHPAVYAKNLTLRYPVFIPFGGNKLKIRLENFCGKEDVNIESVYVALGEDLSGKQSNEGCYLTFDGKKECKILAGGSIVSDPLDFMTFSDKYLVISIYLKDYTNLESGVNIIGPLSKGYYAYGNQSEYNSFDINSSDKTNWVHFLTNVDVYTDDDNYCVICYGDSITSQDWPDYMMLELKEQGINNIAVVRKAVSGTRILREYNCITYQSYGLKGEKRFLHEISSVEGAKDLIIQHGINDIIHPVGEDVNIFRPMSDLPSVDALISGMNYYLDNASKFNLNVYVGTLLPIYNWRTYALFREELKNKFNDYLLTLNCIDFNNEIGESIDGEYHFKELCDSGDHLHPSKYAYKKMGALAAKKIIKKSTGVKVRIEIGNIVEYDCDAIVNAANSRLMAGGGVCGAIFKAAGYEKLSKECMSIGWCETGHAVITKGYNLKAKYIIHTVGPIYSGYESAKDLKNAYYNTLKLADDNKLKSIAIPSISTGIYGYPKDKAAKIAVEEVVKYKSNSLEEIILVCFDKETYDLYMEELNER